VTIHYLRPGPLGRVDVEARPLKFGKRASIVAINVYSPAVPDGPIASGTITFAPIFPKV
jgi:acyl-coenzyme A thioesterase PaaI-like protein